MRTRIGLEAVLATLTQDVVQTSDIEGETLDPAQVRSSLARRLGMDFAGLPQPERHVEGVAEMVLDATQHYTQPLTDRRLFAFHAALFPTGYSGMWKIVTGDWRSDASGPMQVVSGPMGRERVHYEAPHAGRIDREMQAFLIWYESPSPVDPVLRAAIAHLWFVTIHPFDDGNGRIARAIADMSLARSEGTAQRFYSMSAQIRAERDAYYDMLEATQKGDLDITDWLLWFIGCLDRAFDGAERVLEAVIRKARLWSLWGDIPLNARQRPMIDRLLDGFTGKLTSSKWAKLTKTSQDTAARDIADLIAKGILRRDEAGGRSSGYLLCDPPSPR